ncbi:MAG: cupin domain-containing protein [Anaerolineaceae bacterium]|nr:cupin domain-containing protein [Anaerolineaceae bacterium]
MPVIRHAQQPATKGYYSKIINRQIVTSAVGATSFVLWEQVIPPGGYIVPHYHEVEEALTFLSGSVQVTMGDEHYQVEAGTTVFIRPFLKHSVLNRGDEPTKLIALVMSADAEVIYPDGFPEPVIWEDDI